VDADDASEKLAEQTQAVNTLVKPISQCRLAGAHS
jgi:hypothetical protein